MENAQNNKNNTDNTADAVDTIYAFDFSNALTKVAVVLREKGKKFDQDKPMVDLLVPEFIESVARVMTMGAKKYGLHNWKKGLEPRRILAALYRHTLAYHRGEKIDPESGESHLAHIAANAMFLFWYDNVGGKKCLKE